MARFGVVTVGTELTLGLSTDTNGPYICALLAGEGHDCVAALRVPDALETIVRAISALLPPADFIVITGGLGSTHDDITREAIAEATGRPLATRPELEALVRERAGEAMPPEYMRQAQLPEGARAILPGAGTAPGFLLRVDDKLILALPGVPAELRVMLEDEGLAAIREMAPSTAGLVVRKVLTCGAPEPAVAEKIRPVLSNHPDLGFGLLPALGQVTITVYSLTGTATVVDEIERAVAEMAEALGRLVFGFDDDRLEAIVGDLLRERRMTLSVAESCTGGLLQAKITTVAGSSEYFLGGVVAYSNAAKDGVLAVSHETLQRYGAVSARTAEEMAAGARARLDADIALSITGIAGPGGATPEKPVGLVYIGLATGAALRHEHHRYRGDRLAVQRRSVGSALNMLRLHLLEQRVGADG